MAELPMTVVIGPRNESRRWAWLVIGLMLAAHTFQCLRLFPTWRSIADAQPILQVDHAIHLYHGSMGGRFLKERGTNWGYDPFFMAGYPKSPYHDPSSAVADWSQWLAGGDFSPRAYKLGLLLTMITTPLLFVWAGWLMGLEPRALVGALALYLVDYWIGFPHTLLQTGLYGFLWGSVWSMVVVGASLRWHQAPNWRSWLLLVTVASATVAIHPTTVILLLAPLTMLYLATAAHHGWRWNAALWGAVAIVLAVNLFWIVPLIELREYYLHRHAFMAPPANDVWHFVKLYRNRPLDLVFLVVGIAGLLRWLTQRRLLLVAVVGAAVLAMFSLTFAGAWWPATRKLEPMRFLIPLNGFLCLAGGEAAIWLAQIPWRSWRGRILVVAAMGIAAWAGWDIARFAWFSIRHVSLGQRTAVFPIGLRPEMLELVTWIRSNTDNSARILFEDQLRLLEATVPESLHWTPLLPIYTQRQYIGGQYQTTPLLHHYAAFGDMHVAEQPIAKISNEQLMEFLRLYNVGWVICWSKEAREAFGRFPAARRVAVLPRHSNRPTENQYYVYEIEQPHSYFAQGTGKVDAVDYNRLELSDLVPADGRIVLRYHWLDTFQANLPVKLTPVTLDSDPVPFIGIETEAPIERLVIENIYGIPSLLGKAAAAPR